jgi:hypothetical protein
MAVVKLTSKVFDLESEEIYAHSCDVSDADCDILSKRMIANDFKRLKKLKLVIFLI